MFACNKLVVELMGKYIINHADKYLKLTPFAVTRPCKDRQNNIFPK